MASSILLAATSLATSANRDDESLAASSSVSLDMCPYTSIVKATDE